MTHHCKDCGSRNIARALTMPAAKARGKHRVYTLHAVDGWSKHYFKGAKDSHEFYTAARENPAVLAIAECSHTPDQPGDEPPIDAVVYTIDRRTLADKGFSYHRKPHPRGKPGDMIGVYKALAAE